MDNPDPHNTKPQNTKPDNPEPQNPEPSPEPSPFAATGEMVAPLLVASLIGVALDRWLETSPWLMIIFFVLGAAAGIRGVFRLYKQ